MSLFRRKPLYSSFTIVADARGVLCARFNAATNRNDVTLHPSIMVEQILALKLHPEDSALMSLALQQIRKQAEDAAFEKQYNDICEQRNAREKRIARLLDLDRCDLQAPERPRHRHLIKNEPPRRYKSFSLLTGTPDNIRASLKLLRPEMYYSATNRSHTPRFTMDFDEHRLLYEHNNNGHLNYDDKLMVHEALLELRAHKIQNNMPVIALHASAARPERTPERPRFRGFGIYF